MSLPQTRRLVITGPAATKRAQPHRYNADPDAPGTCRCRLVKGHRLHDAAAVAAAEAEQRNAQVEERRRLGEQED
jgi:hypothetical protein